MRKGLFGSDIIRKVNELPEDKLKIVESFLNEISAESELSEIDSIYKKAAEKYHDVLQKLAQ